MDALFLVVGAIAGIGGGAFAGVKVGHALIDRPSWWFWAIAAVTLSAGVALSFAGLQMESDPVFVAGVGVIAGGLTGLKYGARRVPGMPAS